MRRDDLKLDLWTISCEARGVSLVLARCVKSGELVWLDGTDPQVVQFASEASARTFCATALREMPLDAPLELKLQTFDEGKGPNEPRLWETQKGPSCSQPGPSRFKSP